ncbi:MAG: hypothetical protein ACYCWW_21295 [Deltaproteobacteria bacterium]
MRGLPVALLLASGCIVPDIPLAGLPCDPSGNCLAGYVCVANQCVVPGGNDAGSGPADGGVDGGSCSAPPSCTADGHLLLCDGGTASCPLMGSLPGVCDLGACRARCQSGGCDPASSAPSACDLSLGACLPAPTCGGAAGPCAAAGDGCVAGVCVASPPDGGPDGGGGPGCEGFPLADAGAPGSFTVSGQLTLFPDRAADSSLLGGTVTFYQPDGGLLATTSIVQQAFPSYSVQLQSDTGPAFAAVSLPNGGPVTYFPDLQIWARAGAALDLSFYTVAGPSFLSGLPTLTGVTPQPGHLTWIGTAARCDDSAYITGYAVGLSPAPGFVGYYASGDQLSNATSSGGIGEFVAVDAPYATTSYVMAVNDGQEAALVSGTFSPPPFSSSQPVAVALIYPNYPK